MEITFLPLPLMILSWLRICSLFFWFNPSKMKDLEKLDRIEQESELQPLLACKVYEYILEMYM